MSKSKKVTMDDVRAVTRLKFRFEWFNEFGDLLKASDTTNPDIAQQMIDFPAMLPGEYVQITAFGQND